MKKTLVSVLTVVALLATIGCAPGDDREATRTPAPSPSPDTTPSRFPDEGVYAYATTGGEEVDALGGSRHDYPARTTLTVSHAGCGLVERWDVQEGRYEERETCGGEAGDVLRRYVTVRSFFGRTDEREFTCEEDTVLYPTSPEASVTGKCTSEETVATFTGSVVGTGTVEIGGEPREALHIRIETAASGDATGAGSRETWIDTETGLVLREKAETTSERQQAFVGAVRYEESYEITLESLEPSE